VEAPVEEAPTFVEPITEEIPVESVEAVAAVPAEEIPDWLKGLEMEVPVEEAPTSVEPITEEIPVEPIEAVAAVPAEEIPDWLKDLEVEAPVEEVPSPVEPITEEIPSEPFEAVAAVPAEEIPDWLKTLQTETISAEAPSEEAPVSEAPEETPPAITEPPTGLNLEDQDAALAWLEGLAVKQGAPEEQLTTKPEERPSEFMEWKLEEPPVAEVSAPTEAIEGALPEWLLESKEIGGEGTIPAEPVSATAAIEGAPEGVNLEDQDAALAWLESLAEKQGVPEEQLTTKPEERPKEVPEWALEGPAPEAVKPEEAIVEPEAAIPELLLEPSKSAEPAIPTEEIPVEKVSETGMEDAFEWLESLARKHGVPEDQLITHPLKPIEELPDWIKESASIEETTPMPIAPIEEGEPVQETPAEEPALEETAPVSLFEEITQPSVIEEVTQPISVAEEPQPSIIPEVAEPLQAEETQPAWVMEKETIPSAEQPAEVSEQLLDLNSASLSELESLPGIGFVLGQAILAYRETHGPFKNIEALTDVPGIGPERLDLVRDLIMVLPGEEAVIEGRVAVPRDEEEGILMMARSALDRSEMDSAFENYNKLINQKAYLPEIIYDLQDSLYKYPKEILLWQILGDAYLRTDQLQEALNAYIQAEELLI